MDAVGLAKAPLQFLCLCYLSDMEEEVSKSRHYSGNDR